MTLKDIAEKTVSFLGVSLDFSQTGTEQTFVINCVKDVLMRLSGETTDLKKRKSVVAADGFISYQSVDADFKRAFMLTKNGKRQSFTETATGLVTKEDGAFKLTYSYFLRPNSLTATIELPPKYSVNVLALGAAGEYCYRKGAYKESETYDERYLAAIRSLERTVKSAEIKAVDE